MTNSDQTSTLNSTSFVIIVSAVLGVCLVILQLLTRIWVGRVPYLMDKTVFEVNLETVPEFTKEICLINIIEITRYTIPKTFWRQMMSLNFGLVTVPTSHLSGNHVHVILVHMSSKNLDFNSVCGLRQYDNSTKL